MKMKWILVLTLLAFGCRDDEPTVASGQYGPPPPPAPDRGIVEAAPKKAPSPVTLVKYEQRTEQPPPKMATPDVDIVGLKLGMTPTQALKVMRQIFPIRKSAMFTVNFFETEPLRKGKTKPRRDAYELLSFQEPKQFDPNKGHVATKIQASGGVIARDGVLLEFSVPPEPNVVVAISRTAVHQKKNAGTSLEVFEKALVDKYGKPWSVKDVPVRKGAAKVYKWKLGEGGDCTDTRLVWGSRKGTPSNLPAPEACGTFLFSTVVYQTEGEYQGMVSNSATGLGNKGDVFLNQQRHQAWLAATKANWEAARRDQIRAAGNDTKAPTL